MKWFIPYENDNDALNPEMWAQESLMVLENNMVAANMVYRDFEDEIAQEGDVVNAHRPGTFTANRKTDSDDVSIQDASTTNVPVPLNQHLETSFIIKDGEESMSFKDLVALHLTPAVLSLAQGVDSIVCGQVYQFLANNVGKLGTAPTDSTLIALKELMNVNKVPMAGRNLLITPNVEGSFLGISNFVQASSVGDDGSALRAGNVGTKYGINTFMSQNVPSIAAGNTVVTGAVNNASGYAAGTTSLTVDGLSAAIGAGTYVTIAGDMIPHRVVSTTGGSTPTAMVITPALKYAVLNDAVVTLYSPGAVNLSAGYDADWAKAMVVNGFSVAPKSGQLVAFGDTTATAKYAAWGTPTTTSLLVDRPLSALVANSAAVNIGPAGDYCFGFHRNALALVTRPLAQPRRGTGALSYVASYNGLSVRVTISYNATKQGHQVTVDLLCGVATLDVNLGAVLFA